MENEHQHLTLKQIGTLAVIFVILEIGLRLFWHGANANSIDPGDSKQQALVAALKQKNIFYQERFCDSIHQTKIGEIEVAKCMSKDFDLLVNKSNKSDLKVLTLGASTTRGFSCNSQTNWPAELNVIRPNVQITNLADDGAYSDESVQKLENQIAKKIIPEILIWSHGLTEFLFYGDERDINWAALSQDHDLMNKMKSEVIYKENFILKVLRFDITIQRHWYTYRWMRVMTNLAALSLQNGYRKFLLGSIDDGNNEMNKREKYISGGGLFNGPVRMLFSEPAQTYAIKNYGLNLERLKELSEKNNIKVMCVKIPHVKDLLSIFSQDFGTAYDAWIEKVNQFTYEKCKSLGFAVTDVNECFLNSAAKASEVNK